MIYKREEYRTLFNDVKILLHQTQLFSLFAFEVFNSFPNNIGKNLRADFDNEIIYSLKERELFIQGLKKKERNKILGERSPSVLNGAFFTNPFFEIQKILRDKPDAEKNITEIGNYKFSIGALDFQSVIANQNLVYVVGLIEGFILDSVRLVYYHMEKYIEDHIIEPPLSELKLQEDFEERKIERIIEITKRKWSAGSFSTRFRKLQTKFNINLEFDNKLEAIFDEANLLRNCILHNGAKVSTYYFNEFNSIRGVKFGEPVKVSKYFNEALYYLSTDLINKLYYKVDSYSFQGHSDPNRVDDIYHSGYAKDVMLNTDNWIYKRLLEKGIY